MPSNGPTTMWSMPTMKMTENSKHVSGLPPLIIMFQIVCIKQLYFDTCGLKGGQLIYVNHRLLLLSSEYFQHNQSSWFQFSSHILFYSLKSFNSVV